MRRQVLVLTAILLFTQNAYSSIKGDINWLPHNAKSFQLAAESNKLILLDVEAVWCHWCHVMDATTYQDKAVTKLLASDYIALKVDHDARPDLAERYRDYGWPATIIMTADGRELVKRAGYISPTDMLSLLEKTKRELNAPEYTFEYKIRLNTNHRLSDSLRKKLLRRHIDSYDQTSGGLRLMQKFLEADSVELDLSLAKTGDLKALMRARHSLDSALALIDPAFGGAYQYSTHGDWQHPHYEKIMFTQAAFLRIYSLAYKQLGDNKYLQAAEQVAAYLRDFMQAENGGLYSSQDADLKQGTKGHDYFSLEREKRLLLGLPRIDKNQYASVNGMAIEGLIDLYLVSLKKEHLQSAVKAFDWAMRNRRLNEGGFSHSSNDEAGPYLADSLYMGRALIAMYRVSGQDRWLKEAEKVAIFIDENMRNLQGGLLSAIDNGTPTKPLPQMDQNIHAARFLISLHERTKSEKMLNLAQYVMRYLVTEEIATSRLTDAGIIMADNELAQFN